MPTFVYMTRCDGCGHCVDICRPTSCTSTRPIAGPYNIEPNMCWECYACVMACPQNAIDARGYADFAPLGTAFGCSVRKRRARFLGGRVSGRAGEELRLPNPDHPVGDDPVASRAGTAERRRHGFAGTGARAGCAQHRTLAGADAGPTQAGSGLVGLFNRRKTVFVDSDVLVIGGGMAAAAPRTNPGTGTRSQDCLRRKGEHRT